LRGIDHLVGAIGHPRVKFFAGHRHFAIQTYEEERNCGIGLLDDSNFYASIDHGCENLMILKILKIPSAGSFYAISAMSIGGHEASRL